MAVIRFDTFRGALPGINPRKLPAAHAQVALDVKNETGALEPLRAPLLERTTSTEPVEALFRYTDTVWCEWGVDVDVVRSIIVDDPYDRIFYTGMDRPRAASNSQISDGSGGPYPAASFQLGVPLPTASPQAVVSGTADDPNDLTETRYYRETFVNSWGEEGAPHADASTQVELRPGQVVDLTLSPVPAGSFSLSARRVYCSSGGAYQLVTELPIGTTTYADPYLHSLGEELPSVDWDVPDENLAGLVSVAGHFLAGFVGHEVHFSESELPHAWPVGYRRPLDYPVVGLAVYGNTVVACTTGIPYAFYGAEPSAMVPQPIELRQACTAKRAVVSMGYGVVYPSPDGLVLVGQSGAGVVTKGVFTRAQWQAMTPATMRAVRWEQFYLCFYEDADGPAAFAIDPQRPELGIARYTSNSVQALLEDLERDTVYFAEGDSIYAWDRGALRTLRYRSPPQEVATPSVVGVVQIFADTYPCKVRVYADGKFQFATQVASDSPVRVGGQRRARRYEVEVETQGNVTDIMLASTMRELKSV